MRGEYDDRGEGFLPPRYLHLPTVDNHAPTLEHLHRGIEFIGDELERGGQVYIHCWEGVGRGPTMLAAYLVSTGLKPSEAWAKIRAVRPFIRPTLPQIAQIDLLAAEYGRLNQPPLSAQIHVAASEEAIASGEPNSAD
jgi:protein-tyrosine phosphatase